MCNQVIRVSVCWQCSTALEPFGRIRACADIVENGKFCEFQVVEIQGPPDLLCTVCLKEHKGENKRNDKQKLDIKA